MLNINALEESVGTVIYNRGLDLYKKDGIIEFNMKDVHFGTHIVALIKGNGRKAYTVELGIDSESGEIFDSYCTCPAYNNYAPLCKHCIAAVLGYIDYNQPETEKLPLTTPSIKRLLELQTMKRALPYLTNEAYGKIRLETSLEYGYYGFSATFKIGYQHMYILKDVFDFAKCIYHNAHFSYGKKLAFIHTLEAFDKQAIPLVKFICRWAANHEEEYQDHIYKYGYGYTMVTKKTKKMLLTDYEFEEFIELLQPDKIPIEFSGNYLKNYVMTEEQLEPKLYLRGLKHGLELELPIMNIYSGKNYDFHFENEKIYKIPKIRQENVGKIINCIEENGGKAYIQREDVPFFCRDMLPLLEKYFGCVKENFNE